MKILINSFCIVRYLTTDITLYHVNHIDSISYLVDAIRP